MSGRGGRDRFHRDYPSRSEEKVHHGRSNPPSRHLWVGNLSHDLDEATLARHFLRFGDLESVAYQPSRSYAFINFRNEDGAFAAVRELQGFSVAGHPLKIEFAKADKAAPRRGEEGYMPDRDEQLPIVRSSPFSQRETRARHASDTSYSDKSKMNDKNAEPSEVLWIGFPAQLKVDEFILRKAFSPFGEIDRITAFSGRTYAFVRFKRISSACRAKETLHGKLFDNPRVHICFAKSESGLSSRERDSLNAPSSPDFIPHGRQGFSENLHHDRNFGMQTGERSRNSPGFVSNLGPDYSDFTSFGRKNAVWSGEKGAFDRRRFPELDTETEKPANVYLPRKRPSMDRGGHFREYSPEEFHSQGPFYAEPFDLPEDTMLFSEPKRLTPASFPPENELPEYPFSESGQINHMPSRPYPDFRPNPYERNTDSETFGCKHNPDRSMQLSQTYMERNDLKNVPFDGHKIGSDQLVYPERKQLIPESHRPFKSEEWKWEGTIAKGGTPICRARCFPAVAGAVMDMILPDFLDCTAKTSLDALTKHYYQAASSWVVFFVPASDPDITFYNEFKNYLGEKERAAVAKLDDRTTLFLVPPSDFSEKILKVPGTQSISGVILKLDQPSSSYVPAHLQQDQNKTNFVPSRVDTTSQKLPSASVPYLPASLPTFERPGATHMSVSGNFSSGLPPTSLHRPGPSIGNFTDLASDNRHEYAPQQQNTMGPSWSPHNVQNASVNTRMQGYNPSLPTSRSSNASLQDKPVLPSSVAAAFQPEQLVQLASTLLEQQRQSGAGTTGNEWQQQRYPLPSSQLSSELSSQYVPDHQHHHHHQQQQQIQTMQPSTQRETHPPSSYRNQQQQHTEQQEEGDPEKRLQATLQLAAALIQQIQQGKGT